MPRGSLAAAGPITFPGSQGLWHTKEPAGILSPTQLLAGFPPSSGGFTEAAPALPGCNCSQQ